MRRVQDLNLRYRL